MRRFVYVLLWFALLASVSCAPPANHAVREPENGPGPSRPRGNAVTAKAASEDAEETWDSVYIEGSQVGHVHTTTRPADSDDQGQVRIKSETALTIERFGQVTKQSMSFESVESSAGEVSRFECRMTAGPAEMIARGRIKGRKAVITSETAGKSQSSDIDWEKSWGGFFAVEQSLRAKPLKEGEVRELRGLMPDFPFPGTPRTLLEGLGVESTELLDGSRDLLKVKQTIVLDGGNKIESFLWMNEHGEALKSQVASGLPLTSYRTTKEVALGKTSPAKFDLGRTTTIKVARPLKNAHQTKRVVYRAKLKEGDPLEAFVAGPSQSVRSIDKQTVEVVVRAIRPDEPVMLDSPDEAPTEADRTPNGLIQSDDKRVVTLANGAAPGEQDPWKLAVALEKHVKQSMKSTNFSQAFATAAETAASLEGDCTEHAMLLAAVCRARKLPARVAVGLVYDGQSGFAFHMWTEVWIADRWIGLDATRGDGGIGGAHLKIAHSNLKVSSITSALFPVFNVLGRLELEIVEAE